jgi:hypothetical protein
MTFGIEREGECPGRQVAARGTSWSDPLRRSGTESRFRHPTTELRAPP